MTAASTVGTLSKAQALLLGKAAKGPLAPYNAEWTTFYKLGRLGLMAYEETAGIDAYKRVAITDAGRAALKLAGAP